MGLQGRLGGEELCRLGFRLTSSTDVALARSLIDLAGLKPVCAAVRELSGRRGPRPSRVANFLGVVPRDSQPYGAEFQRIPMDAVARRAVNRARGWR